MNKCLSFVPTELGWCSVNCARCDRSKCKHCVWGTQVSEKRIFCMYPECVKEGGAANANQTKAPMLSPWLP